MNCACAKLVIAARKASLIVQTFPFASEYTPGLAIVAVRAFLGFRGPEQISETRQRPRHNLATNEVRANRGCDAVLLVARARDPTFRLGRSGPRTNRRMANTATDNRGCNERRQERLSRSLKRRELLCRCGCSGVSRCERVKGLAQ